VDSWRVRDVSDYFVSLEINHNNVRGVRNVEALGIWIDGEIVPASLAADRDAAQNAVIRRGENARSGDKQECCTNAHFTPSGEKSNNTIGSRKPEECLKRCPGASGILQIGSLQS
jgi:hypothetical protein